MGLRAVFSLTKVRLEYNQQAGYFTDDTTWGFSNVEIQTDPKKCSGAIVDQFFSLVEEGSSLSEPVQGGETSKGGASPEEGGSGGGGADDDDTVSDFTRAWDSISGEVKAEMRASLLLKNHTDNATEGFIGMIDDMLWNVGNGVVRDFHKSHGREETPETQAPEVLLRRIQQAAQRRKQELADAIRKHEDLQQLAVSATEKHAHAVEEAERKREVAAAVAASTKLLFKETHQAVEAPDLVGPLALIQTTATERAAVSLKVLAMNLPDQSRSTPLIPPSRCGTCGPESSECQLWCSYSLPKNGAESAAIEVSLKNDAASVTMSAGLRNTVTGGSTGLGYPGLEIQYRYFNTGTITVNKALPSDGEYTLYYRASLWQSHSSAVPVTVTSKSGATKVISVNCKASSTAQNGKYSWIKLGLFDLRELRISVGVRSGISTFSAVKAVKNYCSASKSGTDCRGRWNSNHACNGHAGNDFNGIYLIDDLGLKSEVVGTTREKDQQCGARCKKNPLCEFWVREVHGLFGKPGDWNTVYASALTDNYGSAGCWVKKGFTGFNPQWGWMRRGNFDKPKTLLQKTIASANELATDAEAAASFLADEAKARAIKAKTKADVADTNAKNARAKADLAAAAAKVAKAAAAAAKTDSEEYARLNIVAEKTKRESAAATEHAIRKEEEQKIAGEALKAANAAHKAQKAAGAAATEAHTAYLTSMNVKIQAKAAKDEADAAKAQGLLNAEEAIKAETRAKGQRKIDSAAAKAAANTAAASVRTSAYV